MANVTTSVHFDLIGRDKGAGRTVEKLGKAAKDSSKDMDKLGTHATKAGRQVKSAGKDGDSAFAKMGKGAKGAGAGIAGLIPVVAGVTLGIGGLAAAWDKTVGSAMRAEVSSDKLAGKLGLTDKAAAKSARVAKTVYGEAWGESLDDVNATVEALGVNLVDVESISQRQLTKMTRSAQVLSDTWDLDVNEVVRGAGQLMRNGLAKDAQAAFDVITRGLQDGANAGDDLFDTLNEYSTQFRKLGITGEYAMSLISAGLKAGARDSDTIADAIKEFSIRAVDGSKLTSDGFKAAGLNAGKMADAIAAGGPKAQRAFSQTLDAIMSIKDPVAREAAGVALLGTKWEDLGPIVVGAMAKAKPEVEGLTGATKRLGETVGTNVAASFTALQRKAEGWMAQIGESALPLLERLAAKIDKVVVPAIQRWVEWFSGEGKFRIAQAFLDVTLSGIQFAKSVITWTGQTMSTVLAWARDFLDAMIIAFGWTGMWGDELVGADKALDKFTSDTEKRFRKAGGTLDRWNSDVEGMRDEVKLRGDIADLDRKLASARRQLKDKNLTKERRAKLNADITRLLENKRRAQNAIDSLRGKTVYVNTYNRAYYQRITDTSASSQDRRTGRARASGGPVSAGLTYWVGEQGPELVTPTKTGYVHNARASKSMVRPVGPSVSATPRQAAHQCSGGTLTLDLQGADSELIRLFRKWIRTDNLLQGAR